MFKVVLLLALVALATAFSAERVNSFENRLGNDVYSAHPCNFNEDCGIHDFVRVGAASKDAAHTFTVWTRQNNFAAACPSMLMEVSDPASPKYGQHLTFEQIHELTYDAEALNAVHNFLTSHGIPEEARFEAPNGEYVVVTAPVELVERMFNTEMHTFNSVERESSLTRSEHYTMPAALSGLVHLVTGLNDFPMTALKTSVNRVKVTTKRQFGAGVVPNTIFKLYNMPNETDATPKADIALFESLGQSFSPSDLQQFQTAYNIPQQKVAKIIGPNSPSDCSTNPNNCAEANLDVQYAMALAQGAPMTYWSIPGQGDIFMEFIQEVAKDPSPPQVYSISYGGPESLNPHSSMTGFNNELCKLGLRGITMFVASGDDGVAGSQARGNPSMCGFNPDYPASCPYITSVGATMGPEIQKPEEVCQSDAGSIITTGSGFSAFFTQPSYQSAAVANWFATGKNIPPKSMFATGGRAYPDVSALGNAYNVVIGGQTYQLSGTSAACPVFAGMVTLINGDREVRGKSPLGFLNPLLYSIKYHAYNDITSGENNCAAGQGNPVCCQYGFTASKGWDAASGLGSLDFPVFAQETV
eukprot:TRINITY_DN18_c0_g1_i1.p1 TRINITY_DN18_c0_g1~~TRINITY_DN18_c0_g1_i1.p1  ORF type:complete len:585 (-),score=171.21 TRINITY_DN18_c0_g1_i1:111-1865(-)